MEFNESLIDFIVESENNQDTSNETIKNKVEKEITDIPETISNELEFKTNNNVDHNNEKTINGIEKQLMHLRRRRHEEYLDNILINRIWKNKKIYIDLG